jgi:molecular chaperone GrpE
MNSDKQSKENQIEEPLLDGALSIDDFIKELEEKEKDLHISSDLVVEIEESDIQEVDTLEFLRFLDSCQESAPPPKAPAVKSIVTDYQPFNENVSKLESELARLREQVSKFEVERSEVNELARRRQYDFDNYRKRMERERGEMLQNLLSSMAMELLPVLDNLSRALDLASALPLEKSNDFQQFVDGIQLVNQQLNEVLEEMGIQPILSVGEPFDPHVHEAVAAERTDAFPPHTVLAELLRGYRLGDKVIRHSLVKVSTSATPETE